MYRDSDGHGYCYDPDNSGDARAPSVRFLNEYNARNDDHRKHIHQTKCEQHEHQRPATPETEPTVKRTRTHVATTTLIRRIPQGEAKR